VAREPGFAEKRPFYHRFAWAYDVLIQDPIEPWVDAVERVIVASGASPPARVLDVGCGTGRHAAALVARGHKVDLVDASEELMGIARARVPDALVVVADVRTANLCTPRYSSLRPRS